MMRQRTPEGIVAAYVWDYAGDMEMIRHFWDAAVALDPAAADLDESVRFPICRPDRLEALWRDQGFADVATRAIEVPTLFSDFADYWRPFLGGQGPAPGYAMSLDEERRTELRDRIRADLPIAADGSIRLTARAWAVAFHLRRVSRQTELSRRGAAWVRLPSSTSRPVTAPMRARPRAETRRCSSCKGS